MKRKRGAKKGKNEDVWLSRRKRKQQRRVSKRAQQQNAKRHSAIDLLHLDLWHMILCRYLDPRETLAARLVCRTWYQVLHDTPTDLRLFAAHCIEQQHLAQIEWIRVSGWSWKTGAHIYAARHGKWRLLEWFWHHAHSKWLSQSVAKAAAEAGQLRTLRRMLDIGMVEKMPPSLLASACKSDHLPTIQWCWDRGFYNADTLGTPEYLAAVRHGSINALRFLWSRIPALPAHQLYYEASVANQLPVFRFLLEERGLPVNNSSLFKIVADGSLAILQYVAQKQPIETGHSILVNTALHEGHMDVAKFLCELSGDRFARFVDDTLAMAVNVDSSEMVRYCIQHGARAPEYLSRIAVRAEAVEVLDLLFTHDNPIDWDAVGMTAKTSAAVDAWYCQTYAKYLQKRYQQLYKK